MKLAVAVLGLSLASVAPAFAATGSAPQPLALRVRAENVEATHLPLYDPQTPIAVNVSAADKRTDDLTVVAAGPTGRLLRIPLVRGTNGTFTGTLSLTDAGTWRLQLAARNGTLRTLTTPVALDLATPARSKAAAIGCAVGSAIFLVFGGGGFLLLRRSGAHDTTLELERAA